MAEFNEQMNLDMDLLNNLNSDVQGIMGSLASNGSFLDHQQPLPNMNFSNNTNTNFHSDQAPIFYDPSNHFFPSIVGFTSENTGGKEILESDVKSSKKDHGLSGKKRKRSNGKEIEKPKEVVHVRAKRGQATDSHSLAERLRREKINEKLRSLQDLVPGCYKTMGMAVMLDVIISYVRSLQNQIEFLSMKLSIASLYYDFNSETDPTDATQGTIGYEAQGMEVGEGYGGGFSYFPTAWPL